MRPAISSNERDSSPISSLRVEWARVARSPRPNWSTSRRKRRKRRGEVGCQDPAHQRDDQHDRPVVGQDVGTIEPGLHDRDEPIAPVSRRADEDHPAVGQARRPVSETIPLQQLGPIGAGDQVAPALVGQEVLARQIAVEPAQQRGELLGASFLVGAAEIVFDHLEKVRKWVALRRTTSVEGSRDGPVTRPATGRMSPGTRT